MEMNLLNLLSKNQKINENKNKLRQQINNSFKVQNDNRLYNHFFISDGVS